MRSSIAAIVCCGLIAASQAADRPAPDPSTPAHHRSAAIYNAAQKGVSLVVMVDGKLLFEDYPNGGAADRAHELASGAKSFSGVMAAAAVRDGLLDLDEKVSDTITEWQDDADKSAITVRQLLSLTGGLEPGERGRPPAYADAIESRSVAPPGERFAYGPVPFQVFGELMRRKLEPGKRSPADYLDAVLLAPLDIEVPRWRKDRDGNPHLPSGMSLTARGWATFGEFVRLGGTWDGEEVIPKDLVDECFRGSEANPCYGLTWWLNRDMPRAKRLAIPQLRRGLGEIRNVQGIPDDLVIAAGAGNQRLYVSRDLKLVAVRQATGVYEAVFGGRRDDYSDAEFLCRLLHGTDAEGNLVATDTNDQRASGVK